jgi:hypothetical protein
MQISMKTDRFMVSFSYKGEQNEAAPIFPKGVLNVKKCFRILAVMCIIGGLAGCSCGVAKNEIVSAQLTAEQQDLISLLTSDRQEILLFDYQTQAAYKRMEVWVEVYQDGVLTSFPAGISLGNDTACQRQGRVAVIINQNPDFQWTITIDENGSRSTHRPSDTSGIAVDSTLSRGYGSIGSATIENAKEIILYSSVFTDSNTTITFDSPTLAERPELLKDYAFVHLIKCKFER